MTTSHPYDPTMAAPPGPIPYHKRLLGSVREAAAADGLPRLTWNPKDGKGMLMNRSEFTAFLDRVEAGDATAQLSEPSIGEEMVWVQWELIHELETTARAGGPVDEDDDLDAVNTSS